MPLARGCDHSIGASRRARSDRNSNRRAPSQHWRVYCHAGALARWQTVSTTQARAKTRNAENAIEAEAPSGASNNSEIAMPPGAKILSVRPGSMGQAQFLAHKVVPWLALLGPAAQPSPGNSRWRRSRRSWPGSRDGVQDPYWEFVVWAPIVAHSCLMHIGALRTYWGLRPQR